MYVQYNHTNICIYVCVCVFVNVCVCAIVCAFIYIYIYISSILFSIKYNEHSKPFFGLIVFPVLMQVNKSDPNAFPEIVFLL